MSQFLLKIKTKSGQFVVNSLQPTSSFKELTELLSPLVEIPAPNISVLSGYPPKPLDCQDRSMTLADYNIKSGDTLIIEEKHEVEKMLVEEKGELPSRTDSTLAFPGVDHSFGGILLRQIVPADNSCLFTSIGFVLGGKVDTTCGVYMRQLIAEELRNNPDIYSEAILGKPTEEYCKWILKPDSWGGAIELAALSHHYGLEIAVVDTQSGVINRFGEDKFYDYRVFLIFDGIHYDPLYREPFEVGGSIQTMFLQTDEKVLQQAEELAVEAKTSRQFTDVNRFTLRCMVCRQELTGQSQAQTHAQQTGHMNFGEIAS